MTSHERATCVHDRQRSPSPDYSSIAGAAKKKKKNNSKSQEKQEEEKRKNNELIAYEEDQVRLGKIRRVQIDMSDVIIVKDATTLTREIKRMIEVADASASNNETLFIGLDTEWVTKKGK